MQETVPARQLVHFGVYEVDLRSGELRKNGLKLKLSGQPFQVLALLLEQPGELVSREEIQKRLWPADTFVDFDHSLNTAINKIREVLSDSAENPRFVETLPRRGYRFIAPVDVGAVIADPSPGPANAGPPSPSGRGAGGEGVAGHAASASAGHPRFDFAHRPEPVEGQGVPLQGPVGAVCQPPLPTRWPLRLTAMLVMLAVGAAVVWYVWHGLRPKPGLIERRLTANSSELAVRASAISPDGRYVAYADDSGVHLKVIDSAETHDLAAPAGSTIYKLAWFPEGNKLLASAEAEDPAVFSLWTISILGGAPQKLRDDAWEGNAFQDGAGIVFVSGKGREIWQMGLEGEEAQKLITASEGESYAMPAVAQGRLWYEKVSVGAPSFEFQVESRDLKGGPPTILVSHPTEIFAFLLLPNERFIYSMTDRPGLFYGSGIWETRADVHTGLARSKPRRLADCADFEVSGLSATADGKRLTFLKEHLSVISVYVGELQGNGSRIVNPQRLTLSDSLDHAYAWTPDSKSVLFDSNRSGNWDIFKQSLDQRTAVKLVASPGGRHRPAMSPDGASVLYLTFNSAGYYTLSRIMRVALTGGPPQWLGDIQNNGEIRCARTANLCVVGDYGPKQRVFYALDPMKGKGRELLRIGRSFFPGGDMSWDVSPDGSSLVFLTDDAEKGTFQIQIRLLAGGPGRELNIDGWTNAENIRWAADGKGWYVTTSSSVVPLRHGDWTLLKVDLSGKAQQLMQGFAWADPIPSPDGRHVAMMGWVPASNVWMFENF